MVSVVGASRALGVALLVVVVAASSEAQTPQIPQPCSTPVLTLREAATLLRIAEPQLERLAAEGSIPARRVEVMWRFNCEALLAWLAAKPPSASGSEATDQQQPAAIGEAPEQREAQDIALRGQRVLLGRGDVVIDVAQFYGRSAEQLLIGIGGGIGLATVEQSTFSTLFTGRVGVFDETELFAGTLFHTTRVQQLFGDSLLASTRQNAFAGIHFGARRTLIREQAGRPDIILSVSGQAPTGQTRATAGAGVVVVKRVDPVVLFANTNYVWILRKANAESKTHSNNRLDVSMGYSVGLNDTLAISMAASAVFTGRLAEDVTLRQQGRYSVRFGLTSWLAKGLYIEPFISFGLAGPGQTFSLGVSIPYTF